MIRVYNLNEDLFGGHPCHIEFSDDKTKNRYLKSSNPDIREAAEWIISKEGQVLPDKFVLKLTDCEFFKIRKGNARIIVLLDPRRHTLKNFGYLEKKRKNIQRNQILTDGAFWILH